MKNENRLVFEVQMINTSDMKILKRLESEGILKRIRITSDGKLDGRMVKK